MPVGPSQGAGFRDPAQVLIDAEACRLRGERKSYREIAAIQGCNVKTAHERVARAMKETLAEPAEAARQFERERLDVLWSHAEKIATTPHFAVAHGKVVVDESGKPVIDDGPTLAARREQRMIAESYRKLDGLDSPTKVEQSGTIRYEVTGVPEDEI